MFGPSTTKFKGIEDKQKSSPKVLGTTLIVPNYHPLKLRLQKVLEMIANKSSPKLGTTIVLKLLVTTIVPKYIKKYQKFLRMIFVSKFILFGDINVSKNAKILNFILKTILKLKCFEVQNLSLINLHYHF